MLQTEEGKEGRKEMFYLTTPSTHLFKVIWRRTIQMTRKETRCPHMGYYFRLAARIL